MNLYGLQKVDIGYLYAQQTLFAALQVQSNIGYCYINISTIQSNILGRKSAGERGKGEAFRQTNETRLKRAALKY